MVELPDWEKTFEETVLMGISEEVTNLFKTTNSSLLRLGRSLDPVLYTTTGQDQDPAVRLKAPPNHPTRRRPR